MSQSVRQFIYESPFSSIVFGFGFIGVLVIIFLTLNRFGGWRAFSRRYPASTQPAGNVYDSPYTRFGFFGPAYALCVQVTLCEAGVYFSTKSPLLKAFDKPFLVPWSSVQQVHTGWGLAPFCFIEIEDGAGEIHVTLPARAESELVKHTEKESHHGTNL